MIADIKKLLHSNKITKKERLEIKQFLKRISKPKIKKRKKKIVIKKKKGKPTFHWKKAYNDYINSPEWRAKRELVLKRDGYKCTKCPCKLNLEVHHLNYKTLFDEDLNDLVTLCHKCHMKEHPNYKPSYLDKF